MLGSFHFGADKDTLDAVAYRMEVQDEDYQLRVVATVTKEGCIPVSETIIGKARGGQYQHPTPLRPRQPLHPTGA